MPASPDPAEHEARLRRAVVALEGVRDQLERTQRSLDAFVAQITGIPVGASRAAASRAAAAATTAAAPQEPPAASPAPPTASQAPPTASRASSAASRAPSAPSQARSARSQAPSAASRASSARGGGPRATAPPAVPASSPSTTRDGTPAALAGHLRARPAGPTGSVGIRPGDRASGPGGAPHPVAAGVVATAPSRRRGRPAGPGRREDRATATAVRTPPVALDAFVLPAAPVHGHRLEA
ncbi:MAG: hypothetical protein F2817_02450 [Actinobacteria bacterium]|nr:hypothetical protein [Actinomycetota bacterium]